jgi:hypothetical protein
MDQHLSFLVNLFQDKPQCPTQEDSMASGVRGVIIQVITSMLKLDQLQLDQQGNHTI